MALKEFFRRLNYEISKRENINLFTMSEFYFLDEKDEHEELEVGESFVSVTAGITGFVK